MQQVRADALADAGLFRLVERRHDAGREVHARHVVAGAGDQVDGPLAFLAQRLHEAAPRPERGEVIARKVLVGALVAVAGQCSVHQLREPLVERLVAEAVLLERLRAPVRQEDVRVLEQLKEDLASALGLQVQDDAFFIRVFEVERRVLEGASAASFADAGPADRVAALRFDLNDLGALVRQEPGACRDRDHGAELNDFYAFQCLAHGFLLCRVIYSIRN